MSIVRIIAIDPTPRDPLSDVVVWQVPEHSRAHELLVEMLNERGIDWAIVESPIRSTRRRHAQE